MKKIFSIFLTILILSFHLGCISSSTILNNEMHPYSQVYNNDTRNNGDDN